MIPDLLKAVSVSQSASIISSPEKKTTLEKYNEIMAPPLLKFLASHLAEILTTTEIVFIKNIFENGGCEDAYPSSYPSGSAPGHKAQKPSKESGIAYFSCLALSVLCFFTKSQSQKGVHGTIPPP